MSCGKHAALKCMRMRNIGRGFSRFGAHGFDGAGSLEGAAWRAAGGLISLPCARKLRRMYSHCWHRRTGPRLGKRPGGLRSLFSACVLRRMYSQNWTRRGGRGLGSGGRFEKFALPLRAGTNVFSKWLAAHGARSVHGVRAASPRRANDLRAKMEDGVCRPPRGNLRLFRDGAGMKYL